MKSILETPMPTREPGQRSTNLSDAYLTRYAPAWNRPSQWQANSWRAWVLNQPVAIICRETLVANLLALDWKITPRDMKYKDELDATIRYYTKLLENGGNNPELSLDYSSLVEWIAADLLDLSFGAGAEVGRKGDQPNGRVAWFKPLDGGTLYPTLNRDFPVVQYWTGLEAVPFPAHAIARTYMSPRPYMDRQGWGFAPPEKVFFAMELLNRGDKYYANLLLDIPTAGILDLGDMEKSSAEEWVDSFKTFMNETEQAFRIPVLYEHNSPVSYIPFGKVPNDIMFDRITMKYAAIVASAYGMSLGDIGLSASQASGETLAGTIRSDVKYAKTGFARLKSKIKYFFDQLLPDTIQFNFVDYDRELNVAMGRARLASATAFRTFQDLKIFSPQELRSQAIADGLFSITMPDEVPDESEFPEPEPVASPFGNPAQPKKKKKAATEPEVVGNPKPPSQGGEGEFNARSLTKDELRLAVNKIIEIAPTLHVALSMAGEDNLGIEAMELPENPAVLDYLHQLAGEVCGESGNQAEISEVLGTLTKSAVDILKKSIVDNIEDIPYYSMVEELLTLVSNKKG